MKYDKATVEVVEFDNTDIITTSGTCNGKVHAIIGDGCPNAASTESASTDGSQW